eukprot:TRINITY_DN1631_c0_g1_i1.p1 TRINITY_DN1631_c0_g1~~TRINITY_DN1631_c0_g1_i1.p1  ORF type:complete len:325 (-),score=63.76 TRINITY_DN1631_c0_g1_i1:341-1315(-)
MARDGTVMSPNESEDGVSSVENYCKPLLLDAVEAIKSELDMDELPGAGDQSQSPQDTTSLDASHQMNNVTDEDQKQGDSSDYSDQMEGAGEKPRKRIRSGSYPVSKNLVSERKRRKKLNEGLYSLRALVPKISKMDKASIVGDAIEYVRELQKQVQDLEGDISHMQSRMESEGVVGDRCLENGETDGPRTSGEGEEGSLVQKSDGSDSESLGKTAGDRSKGTGQQQIIMQLEVVRVEGHIYQLRVCCKRGPGVVAQLMEALEGLGLEVLNANLTSFQESIHNTFIAKISNCEVMKSEDSVKSTILDMAAKHGLLYGDPGVISAC